MFDRIFPQLWMQQSKEIREKLAEDLQIPHTGGVEVVDGEVVTDGYNQNDLLTLTSDKLAAYVGHDEGPVPPLSRLWEISVAKAYSELHPPEHMIVMADEGNKVVEAIEAQAEEAKETVEVEQVPVEFNQEKE